MSRLVIFRCAKILLFLTACAGTFSMVSARTIVLNADVCDQMAVIHEEAVRLGWAAYSPRAGQFDTTCIDLTPESRLLLRYDLSAIPAGQRVIHAELSIPVSDVSGNNPRLFIWRMTAEWGVGVCHNFRILLPKKAAWTVPGARGAGSDRALHHSDVLAPTGGGPQIMNVTEDVAMWYLKLAPNNGWMLGADDPDVRIRLPSPITGDADMWILRVTYEPE